jgi:hypothetical protein
VNGDQLKGRNLEQAIATFLADSGYAVRANVHRTGRSGTTHELDVVGDKSDGLMSFQVVIECKAWASAINKEVVAKPAFELADLGAAKGVIVALSGWTESAELAAAQANVELWGPTELTARLGSPLVEGLHVGHQEVTASGIAFSAPGELARRTLERVARGRFGLAGDQMVWFGPTWLPAWSLQLGLTKLEGLFRNVPRLTRVWNSYEALSGLLVETRLDPPPLTTVDVSREYLRPRVKATQVGDSLTKEFDRWRRVTTDAAKERHARALAGMGVGWGFHEMTVEAATLLYYPLWIAFLRKAGRERIAAADGVTGKERDDLSRRLTAHAQLVRDSLTRVVPPLFAPSVASAQPESATLRLP